jgi:23S rRNA (adenine2030-N6)-methyltransferase
MNYRHAFHAGNFADVVKHAVLTRIIMHLRDKAAAFRVIDTHAGAGQYDLTGEEASRTGEWRLGIGRLTAAPPQDPQLLALLAPYLDAIAAHNAGGGLRSYPGSPLLALKLLRAQDRLIACEFEPAAAAALARHLRGDRRAKAVEIDGWVALRAFIPPKERRGIVLIDPPYEDSKEDERAAQSLLSAYRKWPTGVFLLWYPIKGREAPKSLARGFGDEVGKALRAELRIGAPSQPGGLSGTGLIVVNAPWRLADELRILLGGLAPLLAQSSGAGFSLDVIGSQP